MAHPAPFIIQATTDTDSRKKAPKIVHGMLAFILSKFCRKPGISVHTIEAFATARPSL